MYGWCRLIVQYYFTVPVLPLLVFHFAFASSLGFLYRFLVSSEQLGAAE